MRTFKVKRGRFEGEHVIYDSVKEFRCEMPDKPLRDPWYDLDTAPLDWCVSDDGYVLQCLSRYNLKNKWNQTTYCFRFATGLYYAWDTKSGVKARRLDAQLTKRHRSTLSETGPENYRVNQFIIYVNAGESVYDAYRRAFLYKGQFIDKADLMSKISLLLTRHEARLVDSLKPFTESIDDKIRAKTGKEPSEYISDLVASLLTNTEDLSSKDIRENVKFYLQLKHMSNRQPGRLKDAEYSVEDEKPPLLEG